MSIEANRKKTGKKGMEMKDGGGKEREKKELMKRKVKGAKVEKKLALNGDGKGKQGKRPLNAVSLSY